MKLKATITEIDLEHPNNKILNIRAPRYEKYQDTKLAPLFYERDVYQTAISHAIYGKPRNAPFSLLKLNNILNYFLGYQVLFKADKIYPSRNMMLWLRQLFTVLDDKKVEEYFRMRKQQKSKSWFKKYFSLDTFIKLLNEQHYIQISNNGLFENISLFPLQIDEIGHYYLVGDNKQGQEVYRAIAVDLTREDNKGLYYFINDFIEYLTTDFLHELQQYARNIKKDEDLYRAVTRSITYLNKLARNKNAIPVAIVGRVSGLKRKPQKVKHLLELKNAILDNIHSYSYPYSARVFTLEKDTAVWDQVSLHLFDPSFLKIQYVKRTSFAKTIESVAFVEKYQLSNIVRSLYETFKSYYAGIVIMHKINKGNKKSNKNSKEASLTIYKIHKTAYKLYKLSSTDITSYEDWPQLIKKIAGVLFKIYEQNKDKKVAVQINIVAEDFNKTFGAAPLFFVFDHGAIIDYTAISKKHYEYNLLFPTVSVTKAQMQKHSSIFAVPRSKVSQVLQKALQAKINHIITAHSAQQSL